MEQIYGNNSISCLIDIQQIMSIHYFEFTSDFKFTSETHNYWELVYIDHGSAVIDADGQQIPVSHGEIVFHKPGEHHAIASVPDDPPTVFIITFRCTSEQMQFFCNRRMFVPTPMRKFIFEMISDGQEAYYLVDDSPYEVALQKREDAPIGSEQLIKLNLEMLLIKLIRSTLLPKIETTGSENVDTLTASILSILTNNVYSRITVEAISREVGFSRTHIAAVFKKSCGKTITEYLTELKISEAKYLMRKQLYTVAQIADFLCYDNSHYFCRVFKRETGMTPKQYILSVAYLDQQQEPANATPV